MNLTPELILPRHIPPAHICARAREYLTAWAWGRTAGLTHSASQEAGYSHHPTLAPVKP